LERVQLESRANCSYAIFSDMEIELSEREQETPRSVAYNAIESEFNRVMEQSDRYKPH
jgi:hypothetical protein